MKEKTTNERDHVGIRDCKRVKERKGIAGGSEGKMDNRETAEE